MRKFLILGLLCSSVTANAQAPQPDSLRQKALMLVRLMEKTHYQPLLWNDTASLMLHEKWLEKLDDEKLFFTANDIKQLGVYQTTLDDELLGKGWGFFSTSINIYKKRLQQADSIIRVLLARPFDFSKPDNIPWPLTNYAVNEQELALRWQRYLKWHVLKNISENLTDSGLVVQAALPAGFASLEAAARSRLKQHEHGYVKDLLGNPAGFTENMEDAFLTCIAWCYDPHSSYMNMREKKEFDTEMSASEYSAGFEIEENNKGDKVIGFLQPGGIAWRSGKLHNGDVLVKVKAGGIEKNVSEFSSAELEEMLGGNSLSDVEVTVRTAAGELKTVKLVKEKISDEESIVKSYVLQGKKNIGYINLPGFYSRENDGIKTEKELTYDGCANDVSKEIVKLRKDSIAGLILDLRYNGGGSMWEAMQLAGIFIDIGPVASVKEKDGKIQFMKDPNRGTIYEGPLLVLVNGLSASASEFVSAVLQDYNRAIIMGSSTYGKGSAQVVIPMDTNSVVAGKLYNDYVKVTQRKFYRVNGSTTQWKGVIPDIVLPDLYADEMFKEKINKSALKPDNSKAGTYKALPALPLASLQTRSGQRIVANPYFKSISVFNEWMQERKKGYIIPLQWQSYNMHYKKTMDMFAMLKKDNREPLNQVRNNAFDRERINVSSGRTQEGNDVYLQHIRTDETLREAYRLLLDWQEN